MTALFLVSKSLNVKNIYGFPAIKSEELTHTTASFPAPPFDNYVGFVL